MTNMKQRLEREQYNKFRGQLESLLEEHTAYRGTCAQVFILAQYMKDCLDAYDRVIDSRRLESCRD